MTENPADTLFTEWLNGVAHGDDEFDAFVARHPEHAAELQQRRAEWLKLKAAPEALDELGSSLAERLRRWVGANVDPAISVSPGIDSRQFPRRSDHSRRARSDSRATDLRTMLAQA